MQNTFGCQGDETCSGGRVLLARSKGERPSVSTESVRRPRAARACAICRKRKIKCSGELSRCAQCETSDSTCTYDTGRRDRVKELLEQVTVQKESLVALAKDLRQNATGEDVKKIEATLDAVFEIYSDLPLLLTPPTFDDQPDSGVHFDWSPDETGPYITNEALLEDSQTEDYNMDRDNDSGYNEDRRPSVIQRDETNSSSMKFIDLHCVRYPDMDSYLSTKDLELESSVDPREYPSYQGAQRLFDHYTTTVHDWFPILPITFINQLKRSYQSPLSVANTWTATLNLVFAIGAQHSSLTTTPVPGQSNGNAPREDVIYLSKALLLLEVKEGSLLTALPDMAQVRCLGLLSFYYLGAGHVNRAWIIIGIAVRLAMALDLHIEKTSEIALASDITNSALLWWSLRTLESLLGSITNRPTSIPLSHCSVSYPKIPPYEDYASSSAMSLRAFLRVHRVSQAAFQALYSISAAAQPWATVLSNVEKYKDELERILPVMSDCERLMLHFSWCDTMILVTRPCLGSRASIDRGGKLSPRDRELARQCIKAAQSTARLLPDEPDTHIFQNGPWWCLVHYIMRAVTVLLISSSQENLSSLVGISELTASVTKLTNWLRWLQHKDTVAERGLEVVLDSIQRIEGNQQFTNVLKQQASDRYKTSIPAFGDWDMDLVSAQPEFLSEDWSHVMDPIDLRKIQRAQNMPTATGMPTEYGNGFTSTTKLRAWNR